MSLGGEMTIHLRADASRETGIGHLLRQIAVAEEARTRGMPSRIVGEAPDDVRRLARRFDQNVMDPQGGSWLDDVTQEDIVVFDGYDFGPDQHAEAASRGARVGAVVDGAKGRYHVDVVLNQNPLEDVDLEIRPDTMVLLGPAYALVRKAFRERRRLRGDALRHVVVVFGGTDVARLTSPTVRAVLNQFREVEVTCIVGPAAEEPHIGDSRVHVVRDPPEIASVFDRADAAVSAAGSTTWELLCMGIPTALVQVAPNQAHVARPTARLGAAVFLGEAPMREEQLSGALQAIAAQDSRRRLSKAALDLVDGHGAARFLSALTRG